MRDYNEFMDPSFRDAQWAAMKEDREMTGRQYLFKQVGHAFASWGYIIKWYMKYHSIFPWEKYYKQCRTPYKCIPNWINCPACKWEYHFSHMMTS